MLIPWNCCGFKGNPVNMHEKASDLIHKRSINANCEYCLCFILNCDSYPPSLAGSQLDHCHIEYCIEGLWAQNSP